MSPLFAEWQDNELKLVDIEGKSVSLRYRDVSKFQQYKELLTESLYGGRMALPTGQVLEVIYLDTVFGKYKIPRQADNDKAILDFILSRPNP